MCLYQGIGVDARGGEKHTHSFNVYEAKKIGVDKQKIKEKLDSLGCKWVEYKGEIIQIWWQVEDDYFFDEKEAEAYAVKTNQDCLAYVGKTIDEDLNVYLRIAGVDVEAAMNNLKRFE